MSSKLKIERGVSLPDIDRMANELRSPEKEDFCASFESARVGLEQCCLSSNRFLYSARIDGKLVAIFGLSSGWINEDIGHPWLALSERAAEHPLIVFRTARRVIMQWAWDFQLLCNFVPDFDEDAIRFLKLMGFQFLNEPVKELNITRLPFYMVGGKS